MISAPYHFGKASLASESVYTVSRARVAAVLAGIAYPLLLLWAYVYIVSPLFSYGGYTYVWPEEPVSVWIGVALSAIPMFRMPLALQPVATIAVWIIYLLVYVPTQIIPTVSTGADARLLVPLQITVFLAMVILMGANQVPTMAIELALPSGIFFALFFASYFLIAALIVFYYGMPTSLPSFADVYDVRLDHRVTSSQAPTSVAYLYSWFGGVLNPFLVGLGVYKKRLGLLILGFAGQIYVYGLDGSKSALFAIILVAVLIFLFRVRGRFPGVLLASGACFLIVGSLAVDWLFNGITLTTLFVRRLVITPGLLTGYYHEFFSDNQRIEFSNTILAPFVSYPYDVPAPFLIGMQYFNSVDTRANANIWADGTANWGLPGIILVTLIAGVVVWLFNCVAVGRNHVVVGIMTGVAALSLASSALFTAILTHGIAATLVLLALSPGETESSDNDNEEIMESTSPRHVRK